MKPQPIIEESWRNGPWIFVSWRLTKADRQRVLALLYGPWLLRRAQFSLWRHAKIAR